MFSKTNNCHLLLDFNSIAINYHIFLLKLVKLYEYVYYVCRFLFDESSADYKYYEYQLAEEERALSQTIESKSSSGTGFSLESHIATFEKKNWCQ